MLCLGIKRNKRAIYSLLIFAFFILELDDLLRKTLVFHVEFYEIYSITQSF
jgi:hypothetical protein